MRINATQIQAGDIVVKDNMPALTVGRQLVATVLSMPKNGFVLVSMFGKQLLVETTMELQKGQILNLKVQSTAPKVVMKPIDSATLEAKPILKLMDSIVEQLVGKFGNASILSFDMREIIKKLVEKSPHDEQTAQFVQKLVEDFSRLPLNTISYLLIPFINDDSRGRAQVAIAKEGNDYSLHFDIETDTLGTIESTINRNLRGIDIEVSSDLDDVVSLLKKHMGELSKSLEHYGITVIEIIKKKTLTVQRAPVDVMV